MESSRLGISGSHLILSSNRATSVQAVCPPRKDITLPTRRITSGNVFTNLVCPLQISNYTRDLDPRLLGFTSRLLPPSEDHSLPASFNIGLVSFDYFSYLPSPNSIHRQISSTDRPQRLLQRLLVNSISILTHESQASELSSSERDSSVPILLSKLALHRPKFLCLVGTSNWDAVRKAFLQMLTGSSKASRSTKVNNIGLQSFKICYPPVAALTSDASPDINETLLFVVPSTSGRVVHYQVRISSSVLLDS